MKITKRQLRRIIKEDREGMTGYASQIPPGVSLENAEYEQGYNDALKGLPPDLDYEGRSYSNRRDIEAYEAGYESGQGEIANEGLVRITKRQLRRIIREEKQKLLKEQYLPKVGDIAVIISTGEEVEILEIRPRDGGGEVVRVEFTDSPGETALFGPHQLESAETYGQFG